MLSDNQIIEVKGLTKKYNDFTAVNDLSLNVYEGDVFGFLGPNGAGKSTTIRMLLTLIKPTAGSIKIFNRDINANRNDILRKIGAIVEKPDFYMYLSAYKNLELLGNLYGADTSRKNIMKTLGIVGLDKRFNSKVKTFSHGMKQRLGLAQALLHDPSLIILDEPTTGLDPQGIKEIRDLIISLSKDHGKTVFLSSHILREVELIADRMIIISNGTAKVEGNVKDLLNTESMNVTFTLEGNDIKNMISLSSWESNFVSTVRNEYVFNLAQDQIPVLNKFFVDKNINVTAILPTRSLEDYFLKITGGNA